MTFFNKEYLDPNRILNYNIDEIKPYFRKEIIAKDIDDFYGKVGFLKNTKEIYVKIQMKVV